MKRAGQLISSTLFKLRTLPVPFHAWFCILLVGVYTLFLTLATSVQMMGYDNVHMTSNQLNQSVQSSQFQLALLLSVFAVFPMIVEVIFDIYNQTDRNDERMHWYTRLIVLTGLAVPNILLLTINFGNSTANLYIFGSCYHRVTINGCGVAYMAQVGAMKKIGNTPATACVIFVLIMIAYTCKAFSVLSAPSHSHILSNASIMGRGFAFLLVLYCFREFSNSKTLLLPPINSQIGPHELIMFIYFFALSLMNLVLYIISIYYNAKDELNVSSDCICMYTYVHMTFTVTIIILQSRVARMETINQSKSMNERQAFIRYISHEIRTPLNTVFLGLEFVTSLLKKFHPQEGDESISMIIDTLGDIYTSCEISLSILNDLLTFDKMEGKKMILELELINCCSFIKSIAKPFSVNAKEKNIILNVNYEHLSNEFIENSFINVDHSKMGQVIRNLISNALKFTQENGIVTVHVSHVPTTVDDSCNKTINSNSINSNSMCSSSIDSNDINTQYVRIEVRDTGAGISLSNQKKMFGQYVQFNANKLQKGNGSGLGLWISKGITELHRGRIGGFSEGEGKGSVFYLELPLFFDNGPDEDFSSPSLTSSTSKREEDSISSFSHTTFLSVDVVKSKFDSNGSSSDNNDDNNDNNKNNNNNNNNDNNNNDSNDNDHSKNISNNINNDTANNIDNKNKIDKVNEGSNEDDHILDNTNFIMDIKKDNNDIDINNNSNNNSSSSNESMISTNCNNKKQIRKSQIMNHSNYKSYSEKIYKPTQTSQMTNSVINSVSNSNSHSHSNSTSSSVSTSNLKSSQFCSQSTGSRGSKDDLFHSPHLSPTSNFTSFLTPVTSLIGYSNFSANESPRNGSMDAKEIEEYLNYCSPNSNTNTNTNMTSSPVPNPSTPILNSGTQPIDNEDFLSSADHFMVISATTSRSSFRVARVKNQSRISTPTDGTGVSTGREYGSACSDHSRRTSGQCTPVSYGQIGYQPQSLSNQLLRRITRATISSNEDQSMGGMNGNRNSNNNYNGYGYGSGTVSGIASASGTASCTNARWSRSPTDRLGSGFSTDLSSMRGSETPVSATNHIDRSPQNLINFNESGNSSNESNGRSNSFVLSNSPLLPDLKSALEAIAALANCEQSFSNKMNTTVTSSLFKSSPDSPLSHSSFNLFNKGDLKKYNNELYNSISNNNDNIDYTNDINFNINNNNNKDSNDSNDSNNDTNINNDKRNSINISRAHSLVPFPSRTFLEESDSNDNENNNNMNDEFYNQIQLQNTSQYVNLNSLTTSKNQSYNHSTCQSQNQSQKNRIRLPVVVEDERTLNNFYLPDGLDTKNIVDNEKKNGEKDNDKKDKDKKDNDKKDDDKKDDDSNIINDNNINVNIDAEIINKSYKKHEKSTLSNDDRFYDTSSCLIPNSKNPRKLTFLIVDDSKLNRRMIQRLLSTCDYIILEATDGKDCLKVWDDTRAAGGVIDVILMDNSMPIMTGPQAATIMRHRGFTGLIIGVTGHAQLVDIENFKQCGANAVLPKPLNFVRMNTLVKELLDI